MPKRSTFLTKVGRGFEFVSDWELCAIKIEIIIIKVRWRIRSCLPKEEEKQKLVRTLEKAKAL